MKAGSETTHAGVMTEKSDIRKYAGESQPKRHKPAPLRDAALAQFRLRQAPILS